MNLNDKKAFTLAEVLITLAIIGVVAAISIPSVISNSQQQEFKTGLRKAVSVLNSAITMNLALDGETPYDNANTFGFLMKHMAVVRSTTRREKDFFILGHTGSAYSNAAFYTTDGMRFEFRAGSVAARMPLYENPNINVCTKCTIAGSTCADTGNEAYYCNGCGSYGLNSNTDNTTKPPCLIQVDVNGDKKPNPSNVNCKNSSCASKYKLADPLGVKLTDIFTLMITDKSVIPYGVAAQRAMYQAQKQGH